MRDLPPVRPYVIPPPAVLGRWRDYLRERHFSATTTRQRLKIVSSWVAEHSDWASLTWQDAEQHVASLRLSPASERVYLAHLRAFYRWARGVALVADARPSEGVVDCWRTYSEQRGYASNTVIARVQVARQWLEWAGDDWPAASWRDVEDYLRGLSLSPNSRRVHLSNLRAFYRWSRREGFGVLDPTDLVESPRTRPYLPRPADELSIAATLATVDPPVQAMIAVMATAGLRCCEIAAADWEDLNLDLATLRVHGKGGRDRIAYLAPAAVRHLASLDGTTCPIWPGTHRPRLSAPRVSMIVNRAFRAAGHTTTAHQLRHRAATRALALSGDLTLVRDLLGHATVGTTERYAQVVNDRVESLARRIGLPGGPHDTAAEPATPEPSSR